MDEIREKGITQVCLSLELSTCYGTRRMDHINFVDFRKVNKVTKVGSFPMPFDADALDSLADTSVFSTLDLKSGFWRIEMYPNSRRKDCFCYT